MYFIVYYIHDPYSQYIILSYSLLTCFNKNYVQTVKLLLVCTALYYNILYYNLIFYSIRVYYNLYCIVLYYIVFL